MVEMFSQTAAATDFSKLSKADWLSLATDSERKDFYQGLTEAQKQLFPYEWGFWGRPDQQLPGGDWFVWLILTGRGWGKTKTATETISRMVRGPTPLIAAPGAPAVMSIVADTAADLRRFSVEGQSGFLNVGPPSFRPKFHPGIGCGQLDWPNGCKALLFSAEDPESTRGASGSFFWWDELAKAKRADLGWSNMLFGMREGNPRGIVTTTPRPVPLLKKLIKASSTLVTTGSTWDNRQNLSEVYYREVISPLEGTRVGRQEIAGELIEDLPGALWTRTMIDKAREPHPAPDFSRVVVAVDPSGARNISDTASASIGIVVCARGVDGRGYVLADRSCKLSPGGWGKRAVDTFHEFSADRIVAERNFGGAMVEYVIKQSDPNVPFTEVVASRGKVQRAEPISVLYERDQVTHVAQDMLVLEDQMCQMATDGFMGEGSPDFVDALVWGLSELLVTGSTYDHSMAWVS
jgi:phage terminase large subunit-like protein